MAANNLTPDAIEELEFMVNQAHSVACLLNADRAVDETARYSAGAMLGCLTAAKEILNKAQLAKGRNMADENMNRDNESDECMYRDLHEAASLLLAIRKVAIYIDDDASVALQTMAEKAGYLVDRNIKSKEGTDVVGDYNDWIGLTQ